MLGILSLLVLTNCERKKNSALSDIDGSAASNAQDETTAKYLDFANQVMPNGKAHSQVVRSIKSDLALIQLYMMAPNEDVLMKRLKEYDPDSMTCPSEMRSFIKSNPNQTDKVLKSLMKTMSNELKEVYDTARKYNYNGFGKEHGFKKKPSENLSDIVALVMTGNYIKYMCDMAESDKNTSASATAPSQDNIASQKALLKQKNLDIWSDDFIPTVAIDGNPLKEIGAIVMASAMYSMKVIDPSIYRGNKDNAGLNQNCKSYFFWFPECSFYAYRLLAVTDVSTKRGSVLGELIQGMMSGQLTCPKILEMSKELDLLEITKDQFANMKNQFCSLDNAFDTNKDTDTFDVEKFEKAIPAYTISKAAQDTFEYSNGAINQYMNKPIAIKGTIEDISNNFIIMSGLDGFSIICYPSEDIPGGPSESEKRRVQELMQSLRKGESVYIEGKISSLFMNQAPTIYGCNIYKADTVQERIKNSRQAPAPVVADPIPEPASALVVAAPIPEPAPVPGIDVYKGKRCDVNTISNETLLPKWNIKIVDSSVISSMLKDAEKTHLPYIKINASDDLKTKLEDYLNKNLSKLNINSTNKFTCEPDELIKTSNNVGIQHVLCDDSEKIVEFLNLVSPVDDKARVYHTKTFDHLFESAPTIDRTEETVINGERGNYVAVKYVTESDGTGTEYTETDIVNYLFLGDKLRYLTDWKAFHIEESSAFGEEDGEESYSCKANATVLRIESSGAIETTHSFAIGE